MMSRDPKLLFDSDWEVDQKLSSRLPRSWPAFFARFGRLTSVQRMVVGPILDGGNILVCAATASGKTEAACAPILERLLERREPWTVLYISPTRALVNDLFERLRPGVEALGLTISRRTGDYHDRLDPVPNVLLTTPESFDSLLCRGRLTPEGHVLAQVAAVVLDEIHLMHGTPRGEQLRWLLERLRRLRAYGQRRGWNRTDGVQIVGLSATVPSTADVLASYFPADGRSIEVDGARDIELVGSDESMLPLADALSRYVIRPDARNKILVFCNAKKRVDTVATELAPAIEAAGYRVRGHHAGLAQPEREAAERAVKSEPRIVLFSTSTLEIGVDIGDIDLVVLDGPPPNVAAFLQRIGRGNRRDGMTRVMLCAENDGEALIQRAMLKAARESRLGPVECGPQYAVARQQIASYIYQVEAQRRTKTSLLDFSRSMLAEDVAEQLLDHMMSSAELASDVRGVRLGEEWLEKTRGDIHSNIDGQIGQSVSDHITGDQIAVGVRYKEGRQMAIAGNPLNIKRVGQRNLEVERSRGREPIDAQWSYATSRWLNGASQPQAVRAYLGIPEDVWPIVETELGRAVFHFGGAQRKACFDLLIRRSDAQSEARADGFCLYLNDSGLSKPRWLLDTGPAMLDIMIAEHVGRLERDLGRPRTNSRLPDGLRIAEVREWLNLGAQLEAIQASRWTSATGATATQLNALV